MAEAVLEMRGITKRFGGLTANDAISLTLGKGEILALLGENGAGKTTLMNILFGHYVADEGDVRAFGQPLPPGKPRAAIGAGIGMVHQHFTLAANLTVLDNVIIGSEPLFRLRSRWQEARAKLLGIAARFGLAVDPDARIGDLSVGERQRVEILKALYRDARVLILDEPTAVLTQGESETLFATLKVMAREGLSLVFISHKLGEVLAAADRIVILRGGKAVAERSAAQTSRAELAELMVGRRISRPVREAQQPGAALLSARGVSLVEAGKARLSDVSFDVRSGEILGIIGVSGNGQAALGRLISGLAAPSAGDLLFEGQPVNALPPRGRIALGFGRIPEDRHAQGVVSEMSVAENAALERLDQPAFQRRGFLRRSAMRDHARRIIERFDVRGATPDTRIGLLSGGNMQKLILGRNLIAAPRLILASQPTRGLDEGAIAAVHGELLAARKAGAAIILISEDLDEVLALCDRLQAIVGGRLSPVVAGDDASPERIGLMMAGIWEASHAV